MTSITHQNLASQLGTTPHELTYFKQILDRDYGRRQGKSTVVYDQKEVAALIGQWHDYLRIKKIKIGVKKGIFVNGTAAHKKVGIGYAKFLKLVEQGKVPYSNINGKYFFKASDLKKLKESCPKATQGGFRVRKKNKKHTAEPRPCSCCGTKFQPTIVRTRLCHTCFSKRSESVYGFPAGSKFRA